jgi:protein gp37
MGATTGIEWCDHTFNAWRGSEAERKQKAESGWAQPERWFRAAVRAGVRRRVFCLSQGDVFEDRRDLDAPRERLWRLIELTAFGHVCGNPLLHAHRPGSPECVRPLSGGLDWLLLTKRPENALRLMPERWVTAPAPDDDWNGATAANYSRAYGLRPGAVPSNVWVGVSVQNQDATVRLDELAKIPAAARFVSFEPLLGPAEWPADLRVREFPIAGGSA